MSFGVQARYQYDPQYLIVVCHDKDACFKSVGISFGDYGSQVVSRESFYRDIKRDCKLKRFMDKWHAELSSMIGKFDIEGGQLIINM
ncbi:MAG: hypothetical protein WBL80_02875 [Erysipelotrichaceae bacterium]